MIPPAIVVGASRAPLTRDLCITRIGAFSAAGGHFIDRPRGTSEHILILCISGKGHCTLNGHSRVVEPGDMLFLPPREAHTYGADPRSPWSILWTHFRGAKAGDYLELLGASIDQPIVPVRETAPLADAFEEVFQHVVHGFGQAAMVGLSTAFTRLLGIAFGLRRCGGFHKPVGESRLLQVLERLRKSPELPWTVDQMARDVGLSTPHFTELCRRQTGMPPMAYLIRLRLERAIDLLQRGSHNVAQAAQAVGYDDQFHFSRLFRKHIGTTPSDCRHGP